MPMVRALAAALRSEASAAKAASSGSAPGFARNHARVAGMLAENCGLTTDRPSIWPIGTTKVTITKARSGSTSAKALSLARRDARAIERLRGAVPTLAPIRGSGRVRGTGAVVSIWLMHLPRWVRRAGPRPRPPPRRPYFSSQALNCSLSSVSRSAQNSRLENSAVLMFSGSVGRFGPICVLPSWYMPTSGAEDLRGGP